MVASGLSDGMGEMIAAICWHLPDLLLEISEVDALREEVEGLKDDIATLEDDIEDLEDDVSRLESDLDDAKGENKRLEQEIDELNLVIESLEVAD